MLLRLRSHGEQDDQWDGKAHGGLRVKETDRYYVSNLSIFWFGTREYSFIGIERYDPQRSVVLTMQQVSDDVLASASAELVST